METPLEAVTEVLKFDAAHPQLGGWAMVGGWPLFRSSQSPALMAEIQKRGLKIVAVDALPEQLIYVERGLVPVLWAQPLYDWGAVGVSTIVDKLVLKKTVPKNIRMELIRVTRDDLRAYAKRLSSWGFSLPQEYLAPRQGGWRRSGSTTPSNGLLSRPLSPPPRDCTCAAVPAG